MYKRIALLLILLFALIVSCRTNEDSSWSGTSNLPGMIYDGDNRPCERVVLHLYPDSVEEEPGRFR